MDIIAIWTALHCFTCNMEVSDEATRALLSLQLIEGDFFEGYSLTTKGARFLTRSIS